MHELFKQLQEGGIILLVTLAMFYLAKVIKNVSTSYDVNEEIKKGNLAVGTSLAGYFFACIIIFIGGLIGPSHGLKADLISYVGYGLLGILLLNLSRVINDRVILYHFSNVKELVTDQNPGTGAVEFGSYVASGLVIAGSIHGQGGGLVTALAFYGLSQVALVLFAWVYNLVTPFDLHAEIERDNIAVGVAFGGHLTALGIILMRGAAGDFISWEANLTEFFFAVLAGILLLPLIRMILDLLMLRNLKISEALAKGNLSVGFLEAAMSIGFASLLFYLLDFHSLV